MLIVQKCIPMWQNHLRINTAGNIFMTKALFLIFSIFDLNIYMYVGGHTLTQVFQYKFCIQNTFPDFS